MSNEYWGGAEDTGFCKICGSKFEPMLKFKAKSVLRVKSDSRSLRSTQVIDILLLPDS